MLDWNPQPPYTAEQLLQVIRILRDPENGCPWDKVQTHASIRKNFLEETCEALEAIDADDAVLLREELGDVLMQVVFHAAMEEERGRFTFEDVCRNVCEKLVFRHPNIFASLPTHWPPCPLRCPHSCGRKSCKSVPPDMALGSRMQPQRSISWKMPRRPLQRQTPPQSRKPQVSCCLQR